MRRIWGKFGQTLLEMAAAVEQWCSCAYKSLHTYLLECKVENGGVTVGTSWGRSVHEQITTSFVFLVEYKHLV